MHAHSIQMFSAGGTVQLDFYQYGIAEEYMGSDNAIAIINAKITDTHDWNMHVKPGSAAFIGKATFNNKINHYENWGVQCIASTYSGTLNIELRGRGWESVASIKLENGKNQGIRGTFFSAGSLTITYNLEKNLAKLEREQEEYASRRRREQEAWRTETRIKELAIHNGIMLLKNDWEFCRDSNECKCDWCTARHSHDGRKRCTPKDWSNINP